MAERTVEEIVTEAKYAREHAEAAVALPSVLAAWVKSLADDVEMLAARIEASRG